MTSCKLLFIYLFAVEVQNAEYSYIYKFRT